MANLSQSHSNFLKLPSVHFSNLRGKLSEKRIVLSKTFFPQINWQGVYLSCSKVLYFLSWSTFTKRNRGYSNIAFLSKLITILQKCHFHIIPYVVSQMDLQCNFSDIILFSRFPTRILRCSKSTTKIYFVVNLFRFGSVL